MNRVQRGHVDKFMTAALENNLGVLQDMIEQEICGPGVNFTDRLGRTSLHCLLSGATFENLEDLKRGLWLLKDKGAAVNLQDRLLNTPLHLILETYDVEIPSVIELVLEIFPDYDWTLENADGCTVFKTFLFDVNHIIEESDELDAVLQSRDDFIKRFLNGNVQGTDAELITVLLNTKKKSHVSAFQTYVESIYFDTDIVELMIKKGANVNTCNNLGHTPLMDAAFRQRDDLVNILLEAGADPNARDMFGQTVLFRVRTELSFKLLYKYGVDLSIRDRSGKSPLTQIELFEPQDLPLSVPFLDKHISQYPPTAILLLDKGLDPDSIDIYGSSLLHYAAWWGDPEVIQLLLEYNATPDVTDGLGMTPYDIAAYHGNYDILDLLETETSQPIVPQCTEIQLRLIGFSNTAINEIIIDDIDNVLDMLNIRDEPEELISQLFALPQYGMVSRKPEAVNVVQSVNEVIQKVAHAMSTLDERFRASIKPIGSSPEGTMIGDPYEFDFVFCLEYFSEECEVIQPDDLLDTGFCKLALKQNKDDNHPLKCFEKREGFICTSDVKKVFEDLLCQALNQPKVWQDIHVYFNGILKFPVDKPILKLKMKWYGPIYKEIEVKVDIVPAIHKRNWFPKEINQENLNILSDKVKKAGFFILFHGPELPIIDQFNDYVRISSAAMETAFFKTSSVIVREIYAICKILKRFCPMAEFNEAMYTDESSSEEDYSIDEDGERKKKVEVEAEKEGGKEQERNHYSERSKPKKELFRRQALKKMQNIFFDADIHEIQMPEEKLNNHNNKGIKRKNVDKQLESSQPDKKTNLNLYTEMYTEKQEKGRLFNWNFKSKNSKSISSNETSVEIYSSSHHIKSKSASHWVAISGPETKKLKSIHTPKKVKDKEIDPTTENAGASSADTSISYPRLKSANKKTDVKGKRKQTDMKRSKNNCSPGESSSSGDMQIVHDYPSQGTSRKKDADISQEEFLKKCMAEVIEFFTMAEEHFGSIFSLKPERHQTFQILDEETDLEEGEIVHADKYITSYMLKNCLLHVLHKKKMRTDHFDPSHISIMREIFTYLLRCSEERRLNAYCLPFVDIFSYVNEFIRLVDSDRKEAELQFLCYRIGCFCKIILGILTKPGNNQKLNS